MNKEQFKAQLKDTVDKYIKSTLSERTKDEVTDISVSSKSIVDIRLTDLVETVEQAIERVSTSSTSTDAYYWKDGAFYTNKLRIPAGVTPVPITTDVWNDWCTAKDHPEEGAITEKMDKQILIKTQTFITSAGGVLKNVSYWITTTTPYKLSFFYFTK